eukprot:s259_g17.t1
MGFSDQGQAESLGIPHLLNMGRTVDVPAVGRPRTLSAIIFLLFLTEAWQSFVGGSVISRGHSSTLPRRAEADPCTVLGLPPGTRDEEQIRGAFRRLAKVYHPDVPQTGDIGKFQELQRAAQKLITGQAPAPAWDAGSLESLFTQTSTHAQRPPSVAHRPLEQADFAGTRNGRVDVAHCTSVRTPNLRKTPRLERITHQASPETLARASIGHHSGFTFIFCHMSTSLWVSHAARGVSQQSNQSDDATALKAATSVPPVFDGNATSSRSLKEQGNVFSKDPSDECAMKKCTECVRVGNEWRCVGHKYNGVPVPVIVALVVMPLVLLCLFLAWRKQKKDKKKEQELEGPPNPDPELQPASAPSQILPLDHVQKPATPAPSVQKAKPPSVQFAWGQMSAQWPRGKVANFTVETESFEAFGHQYSIEPADVREPGIAQFHWGDGTLQISDSIDRNTIWWRTNHPNPDWQRFLWVCTPPCTCGPASHAMEFSVSSYKCSVCRSQGHEKHWQCVQHDIHFCCNCAVPPLTPATLGVSARYVVDIFPSLARSATGLENPNFYEICPRLALGEQGLGFGKTCPRDGQQNCSLVDSLEDQYSGKVTHFVSWCWGYTLQDFASAIHSWLQRSKLNAEDVFLWVCFFCNNQYRIMDSGSTKTGSDELKSVFETHLAEAGCVSEFQCLLNSFGQLVLLDKFLSPIYIQRAWCIFECYVCIEQEFSMSIILSESAEAKFTDALSSSFLRQVRESLNTLDVRGAKASCTADEDLIKKLILNLGRIWLWEMR